MEDSLMDTGFVFKDGDEVQYNERSAESASENVEKIVFTKKDRKRLKKNHKSFKKIKKLLKKQNKLLEENQRREAEETTKSKRVRGFLSKVGDAFCKALPKILTISASAALGYFFNTKGRRAKAAA